MSTDPAMKAHPESIFVDSDDLEEVREMGSYLHVEVDTDPDDGLEEFVPAAAYLELKAKLADIWSEGYVAGQAAIKEGKPQRNPYAVVKEKS